VRAFGEGIAVRSEGALARGAADILQEWILIAEKCFVHKRITMFLNVQLNA
jgi:hypothetical protein